MLEFIMANLANFIVGGIVLVLFCGALFKLISDKKHHRNSCGCGCDGCSGCSSCAPKKPAEDKYSQIKL